MNLTLLVNPPSVTISRHGYFHLHPPRMESQVGVDRELLAAAFKCVHSLPQSLQPWVRRNLLQGTAYTLELPLPKYTSLDKRQHAFRHFEVLLGRSLLSMK